jgi:uncharacterized membrane protein
MPPKYGISTYGKEMIVNEGLDELPPIRYILILINIFLFVIMVSKQTSQYLGHRTNIHRKRGSSGLLTTFFIAYSVNNILRNCHMVDHILRPVYYHEPKWAYAKILFAEMEVPTYSNFGPFFFGMLGVGRLMRFIESGNRSGLSLTVLLMALYTALAAFGIVHYTIEPPSNYGAFQNLNIGGTVLTCIPIVILLIYIYFNVEDQDTRGRGRSNEGGSKEKLIGGSENPRVTRSTARRRSKTPVKK